jgi:hypothetical protein
MRNFTILTCLGLVLFVASSGCGSDGANGGGGTGGVSGTGGSTGGTGGGAGVGGTGGSVEQMCTFPRDCDDDEPCTIERCNDRICSYDFLADETVCAGSTGLSACLAGECPPIWASCENEAASDGDFCESSQDTTRLGRCSSGACEISPCELALDCWDGDLCTKDICDGSSGECSHPIADDGTMCELLTNKQCIEGVCVPPPPE